MDASEFLKFNPSPAAEPLYNNILVFGFQNAGVSSFINTLATSLQAPRTTSIVRSLSKTGYVTTSTAKPSRITQYLTKNGLSYYMPQFKTNLWESWGINTAIGVEGNNYDSLELDLLMQGMLPERFPMPKDQKAVTAVLTQVKKPNHYAMIHAIGFVISQATVMNLQAVELTKIKSVLKQCCDRGRNPIVIVTKIDQMSEGSDMDEQEVEKTVEDVRNITAGLLAVSPQQVRCIVNYNSKLYDKTSKRVAVVDKIAQSIMLSLLEQCRDFQNTDPAAKTLMKQHNPNFVAKTSNTSQANLVVTETPFTVNNAPEPVAESVESSHESLDQDSDATTGIQFNAILDQVKADTNLVIKVEKLVEPVVVVPVKVVEPESKTVQMKDLSSPAPQDNRKTKDIRAAIPEATQRPTPASVAVTLPATNEVQKASAPEKPKEIAIESNKDKHDIATSPISKADLVPSQMTTQAVQRIQVLESNYAKLATETADVKQSAVSAIAQLKNVLADVTRKTDGLQKSLSTLPEVVTVETMKLVKQNLLSQIQLNLDHLKANFDKFAKNANVPMVQSPVKDRETTERVDKLAADLVQLEMLVSDVQNSAKELQEKSKKSASVEEDKFTDMSSKLESIYETFDQRINELQKNLEQVNGEVSDISEKVQLPVQVSGNTDATDELKQELHAIAKRLDDIEDVQNKAATKAEEKVQDPLRKITLASQEKTHSPEVISELFAANDVLRDEIHELNNRLVKIQQQCEEAAKKATEADSRAGRAEQMASGCKCTIM